MPLTLASRLWRANSLPLSKVIEPLSSGGKRMKTAMRVAAVSAVLLPASLAARVSREARSCRTGTGWVRRQNMKSASQSPSFSRPMTASGRSWIERRSVIVVFVSRRLRRPLRALLRGSSFQSFSTFCRAQ
jgi:hypothetical protein